jgi:hypothetical protein
VRRRVASAATWPTPAPDGAAMITPLVAIENLRPPQTKSCAVVDWSMSPSYSASF